MKRSYYKIYKYELGRVLSEQITEYTGFYDLIQHIWNL